jgi:hypothetical protein
MNYIRTIAILPLLLGACVAAASGDPTTGPEPAIDDPDGTPVAVGTVLQDSTALPRCNRVGPPCCAGYQLDDTGRCVLVITHRVETLHPRYYVLSLIYTPPGKGSSVSYETGAGVAHKVDVSQTLTSTFDISVGAPEEGPTVSFGYSASAVSGKTYQVQNRAVSTLSVSAVNRTNDELPADDDEFVIAFGSAMRISKTSSIEDTFAQLSAPDFSSATVAVVTVGQLKNPALMNSFQASLFVNFQASDYQQILALDPRASGVDVGDPTRYAFLTNMSLTGLLPPNYDNATTNQQTFTRSTSNDVTSGRTLTLTVAVENDGLGVLKTKSSASFSYASTKTDSSDTSHSATATLTTQTRDCSASYSVYFDSLFNTLAFKKIGSATQCQ